MTMFGSYWRTTSPAWQGAASQLDSRDNHCLVVSADETRRELIRRAAIAAAWTVASYDEPGDAWEHCELHIVQLAIIDLQCLAGSSPVSRQLIDSISDRSRVLILVCGNDESPEEEIWVWQRGVWVYLSGIINERGLTLLLIQAREITSKLLQRTR